VCSSSNMQISLSLRDKNIAMLIEIYLLYSPSTNVVYVSICMSLRAALSHV